MPEPGPAVVVNTGPLIALAAVEQLDLLPLLHARGHLPALRPVLMRLRSTGLWLADDLSERAAREAGE